VPNGSDDFEVMDVAALGTLVRQRRTGARQSLRQAAADAGVSVAPSSFFRTVSERRKNGLEEAVMHLAADPRLTPEAADRITSTLREMYNVLAASTATPAGALAVHLRAATTMRPGVPDRLASILHDMNKALIDLVDRGAL